MYEKGLRLVSIKTQVTDCPFHGKWISEQTPGMLFVQLNIFLSWPVKASRCMLKFSDAKSKVVYIDLFFIVHLCCVILRCPFYFVLLGVLLHTGPDTIFLNI